MIWFSLPTSCIPCLVLFIIQDNICSVVQEAFAKLLNILGEVNIAVVANTGTIIDENVAPAHSQAPISMFFVLQKLLGNSF